MTRRYPRLVRDDGYDPTAPLVRTKPTLGVPLGGLLICCVLGGMIWATALWWMGVFE